MLRVGSGIIAEDCCRLWLYARDWKNPRVDIHAIRCDEWNLDVFASVGTTPV